MGFRPSHRNQNLPQPEVCDLTGRLVPAELMVVGESQGFRGAVIGDTAPFARRAALTPTWQDYRRGHVQPFEEFEDPEVSGGPDWWTGA